MAHFKWKMLFFGPDYWVREQLSMDAELPQSTVDFTAGWGDVASMGISNQIRGLMGTNANVNTCSNSYKFGEAAEFVNDVAIGWAGGIKSGAKIAPEFSHSLLTRRFLKQFDNSLARWMNRNGSRLNGDYIEKILHVRIDTRAYRFAPKWWKEINKFYPAWRRALNRIPYLPGSVLYGGGAIWMNESENEP